MSELFIAPHIHAAMVAVMKRVTSVSKDKTNSEQRYQYRGIDDMYAAVQPALAAEGVHMTVDSIIEGPVTERITKSGSKWYHQAVTLTLKFWDAADGSWVQHVCKGESADNGDKLAGKATSYAMKNGLITAFAVPTWEPDNDVEANEELDRDINDKPAKSVKPVEAPAPKTKLTIDELNRLAAKMGAIGVKKPEILNWISGFLKVGFTSSAEITAEQYKSVMGECTRRLANGVTDATK